MRIYKISSEHTKYGLNWSSQRVAAKTADEAIRKAKKNFIRGERLESIELLASED